MFFLICKINNQERYEYFYLYVMFVMRLVYPSGFLFIWGVSFTSSRTVRLFFIFSDRVILLIPPVTEVPTCFLTSGFALKSSYVIFHLLISETGSMHMVSYNKNPIPVIDHSERVDQLLKRYEQALGPDLRAYRGHILRVLSYAMFFLGDAQEKRALVETALVYHDIALWTHHELAYLGPSEDLAVRDNRELGLGLDEDVLRAIIHWHHKITPYAGPGVEADVIEAVRKADWIDATQGKRRMGLTREQILQVEASIPSHGFSGVLQRMARDLGGCPVRGNLRVLRHVFKW
ncbi:hypothetical protein OVA10_04195 [Lelliottia sp. SL45]|uniref:hypothetical protein n=1 Tax=Lelliottia sp. SL45 TaxID=2994665 RepID=UPI0022734A6C|nr:hypothetical protein [Lelliottia sp. SL45]MCY1697285.1 hypothetical protein [Lelliottia sp. SL45]